MTKPLQRASRFATPFTSDAIICLHCCATRGLRCVTPDGAFYTMLDVRGYGSSLEVAEAILDAGVVTVPGGAFGSESEGFLRVSFCADLPVLTAGVERLSAALGAFRT
mgnify:CR=1 FL=1